MTYLDRSWSPPPQFGSQSGRNISDAERWMSGVGGAALAAWALQRRTPDPVSYTHLTLPTNSRV